MTALRDGQILCLYEALNPNGGIAGLTIGFDPNTQVDTLVQWANEKSRELPPGHDFHRAVYVKVHFKKVSNPYTLPKMFPQDESNGSYNFQGQRLWTTLVLEVMGGSFEEE